MTTEPSGLQSQQRRRQFLIVGGTVLVVLIAVVALVVVKAVTGTGGPKSGEKATAATGVVIANVASVPGSVFDQVGVGAVAARPVGITAPALTADGKPRVLYVGAEYCPYCAAERWAVAVALSRFGTLHGLGQTASSPSDVYPNTQTLSFHGATFTSAYLTFTGKEIQSNQVVDGQYARLDTLTTADTKLVETYDAPPYLSSSGSIPFIDFGGKYLVGGASYDPGVLQGKSRGEIAAALTQPDSAIAKAVIGSADVITASI
ncbi:MAG: DUF929 family protein, partial [Actinobacteria bacterium]|nr:DUF929 family protein [Actinomycetota bacterium]